MYLLFTVLGTTQNLAARLFLCLLGSGTCVLVSLFARDLFGRRIGLMTGAIAAIYPGLFLYDGWLYAESVYTFFLTAFAYALYRFQRSAPSSAVSMEPRVDPGWRPRLRLMGWPVVAGISLVQASFDRPNGPLLLGVVFAWAIIMIGAKIMPWRVVLSGSLVITILTIVLIAPWAWRNYRITHQFIPIATGSGIVLSGAYNNAALTGSQPGM
jgi:4-amino-4-deoxy-L-arabinose transferase-like glycosyltransferase